MGTASRNTSASRSRSPREQSDTTGQNIPEMFRSGRGNMASSRSGNSHTASLSQRNSPQPVIPPTIPSTRNDPETHSPPQLNIHDLRAIAADIKDTLSAAISELRLEIHSLNDRVLAAENMADRQETQIRKTTHQVDTHTLQMRDMQRHLEDLDNRGRRHNLRIRGIPEAIDGNQLQPSITALFNGLLNKPPQSPIELERIHRALRPKGRDTDPPRDVICCLVNFQLKEEILRQARGKSQIIHKGKAIQIYQDLSGITLQHRRDLRPLLDVLRSRNIPYKWKFPFCLSASTQGRTALLKVPEDLHHFCEALNIPLVEVPNWYADFRRSAMRRDHPPEEPMETQGPRYRRRRSPSTHRNPHRDYNASDSPNARRAWRDR